jgi:hypothetical protein
MTSIAKALSVLLLFPLIAIGADNSTGDRNIGAIQIPKLGPSLDNGAIFSFYTGQFAENPVSSRTPNIEAIQIPKLGALSPREREAVFSFYIGLAH